MGPGLRRPGRQLRLGGFRFVVPRAQIGDRRVVGAIGLSAQRPITAEMEIVIAGMAEGPHATRTGEVENVAARRRLLRDDARHQTEAVHLADNSVLGDTNLTANLRRRYPLFPQL